LIDTQNLTKKFGNLTAVEDLTLHVEEGEVFGFLGPNGAGKTTTVRMLCCLISKTSGNARIGDYDISNPVDAQKIRRMIGVLPENVGLYEDLSAYQNLDFYGRYYNCPKVQRKERIEHFLKMLELWDKKDVPAGSFSKGMKQKLAIARALIHGPQVLFLDEPTANLDPEASKTVRDFILELKKEGKTIFINTHHLEEADRICDHVGILKTKLLTVGTPEELRESLWSKRTIFQLEIVTDAVVAAVERLGLNIVSVLENKLVIELKNPASDTPDINETIVTAGGRVQGIIEINPTLEDVYLKIVRSGK
jgi:ABC-2 type transport system ATP-binding protein